MRKRKKWLTEVSFQPQLLPQRKPSTKKLFHKTKTTVTTKLDARRGKTRVSVDTALKADLAEANAVSSRPKKR